MNVRRLTRGLSYLGDVTGKRQTYHVFRGSDFYLVLSFSRAKPRAGNFNVVEADEVDRVRARFGGRRGVTAKDVAAKRKGSRRGLGALPALNVLYVLAALGDARIDTRRSGPRLFFNIKSSRA
jgi:hypothetical protein